MAMERTKIVLAEIERDIEKLENHKDSISKDEKLAHCSRIEASLSLEIDLLKAMLTICESGNLEEPLTEAQTIQFLETEKRVIEEKMSRFKQTGK